jgi:hypothetical protein
MRNVQLIERKLRSSEFLIMASDAVAIDQRLARIVRGAEGACRQQGKQ